jgi:Restriction endonuclease
LDAAGGGADLASRYASMNPSRSSDAIALPARPPAIANYGASLAGIYRPSRRLRRPDRGVDAIMFDPDPLRGGKFVLQAKRYTRPVDVAAVRDLYGTVVNEGANRGILVTTSSYGPDAYDFAKDKPLSLVDGPNLIAMLGKHGRRYRVDLAEASRAAMGRRRGGMRCFRIMSGLDDQEKGAAA